MAQPFCSNIAVAQNLFVQNFAHIFNIAAFGKLNNPGYAHKSTAFVMLLHARAIFTTLKNLAVFFNTHHIGVFFCNFYNGAVFTDHSCNQNMQVCNAVEQLYRAKFRSHKLPGALCVCRSNRGEHL